MPIRNEIEQAIKVKSADNVIEKSKRFGFGGGLGVGIGAPQIVCKSPEQFVNLVLEGERIFTSLKLGKDQTLKKIYLSFIADRAGVIIYEDEYSHPEKGFTVSEFSYTVKDYDWQKVIFRKNTACLPLMIFYFGIEMFTIWLVVTIVSSDVKHREVKNMSNLDKAIKLMEQDKFIEGIKYFKVRDFCDEVTITVSRFIVAHANRGKNIWKNVGTIMGLVSALEDRNWDSRIDQLIGKDLTDFKKIIKLIFITPVMARRPTENLRYTTYETFKDRLEKTYETLKRLKKYQK